MPFETALCGFPSTQPNNKIVLNAFFLKWFLYLQVHFYNYLKIIKSFKAGFKDFLWYQWFFVLIFQINGYCLRKTAFKSKIQNFVGLPFFTLSKKKKKKVFYWLWHSWYATRCKVQFLPKELIFFKLHIILPNASK